MEGGSPTLIIKTSDQHKLRHSKVIIVIFENTVNYRLSALGAYLKTKAFGLGACSAGHLIRYGYLLKNKKSKTKSVR